ncbi:MAG: molybdate ABC transporter substrate-binding protein [Candidatus Pristimantibacillus sp.]
MFRKLLFVLLVIVAAAGCSQSNQPSTNNLEDVTPAETVELLISAAASLTDSLNEIQAVYEKEHPIKLSFNFGASGALQQQIEQGAPADLFLSAGKKQMTALVDKQLIDSNKQTNLLTNELVMIVPSDSSLVMNTMDDIAQSDVKKIAIGEPETVPVGTYTRDSLTSYKIWDAIQPKVVFAKDVRQVLSYVETGNTEIGFVYKTDALTSQKVTIALTADPTSHKPIEYPLGIIKASKHAKEAEEFYNYLQSEAAQAIFLKYGFNLPNQ